jgi:hypothetical protein
MKKVLLSLFIILLTIIITPVHAANYELKELIPTDIKTTIVTNNFSYKNFYYSSGQVVFTGIKNLTTEELPISITIGLFNSKKKNIGTINYCSEVLGSREEINYVINVDSSYLSPEYNLSDIKYISVLSDNITCRSTGSGNLDYIGQTVDEIGMAKNKGLDSHTEFLIKILTCIGVVLVIIFIYQFMFTNHYNNFDGDDVRRSYKKYNKQLKLEREVKERNTPKVEEKPKINKSEEVLREELEAKKETGNDTDLHNLYK